VTILAKCPECGRTLAVYAGKLRTHVPPGGWSKTPCPGSGAKVETAEIRR